MALNWIRIAGHIDELDFASNHIAVTSLEDRMICIGKFGEALFAFAYSCPHASGILADGYIDVMGNVVCPVHHYKYSILNGRNVSGEGYFLKTWPVEVKEDGVYVGVETNDLFGN